MDEQEEVTKAEEVTEYATEHPATIDPATGLPVAPATVTLPEVEAADKAADKDEAEEGK